MAIAAERGRREIGRAPAVAARRASRLTTPSADRTAKRGVQPTSGAFAQPSSSAIAQLCSGQATCSPNTMPWLSGPPLCGQRSSSAKTLVVGGAEHRHVDALRPRHAARAEHGDVVDAADRRSSRSWSLMLRSPARLRPGTGDCNGHELPHVDRGLVELEPGVGLAVERELQALPQRLAASRRRRARASSRSRGRRGAM